MATRVRRRRNPAIRIGLAAIWIAIVATVLLWQTATYESVMSVFAEWQFNAIGRYYPAFSYLLLTLLLTLPLLLLFARPRRTSQRPLDVATLRSASTFSRALFSVAGALAVVAIGVLLSILRLPDDQGALQEVTLDQAVVVMPHEGLTRLTGAIAYDRTTAFDEELIVTRRSRRFAPITAPGADPTDIQFFVELPPATDANRQGVRTMTGVLQRGGLPGEIIRLYRYAGHRVEDPYFVLFTGTRSVRWARFVIAGQLIAGALLVAGLAIWQRRRSRKLAESVRVENQG